MTKPNTKVTIAIDLDLAALSRVQDTHLATLWHVAQANPAPHGDEQAGEAVRKIGQEIVRRWLTATEPEMYHHQARDHYWHNLTRFASHQDGDWHPDPEKIAKYQAANSVGGAGQLDGHSCTLPPTQRLACGHCPHQLCEDCERCPCQCQCARGGGA